MKQLLLSMLAVAFVGTILAQDCSNLFFSEYVEGTGNNKALEIYNPTNAPIVLNDYHMSRYSNGSENPSYVTFPTGTTIPAYGTLVVVLDKRDPSGTGQEAPVADELAAKADLWLCPVYGTYNMMYFNGNDAVSLEKISNGAFIDIIGRIGENPGPDLGWNDDASTGYWQTVWYENNWTLNNTLIRKANVKQGVTVNPTELEGFNPALQWDTVGTDVFANLKAHTCDCYEVGIFNSNENLSVLHIYPNPVSNGAVTIQASKTIANIEVYNVIGQLMITNKFDGSMAKIVMDVNSLNSGLYVAKVVFTDNTSSTRKVQIK